MAKEQEKDYYVLLGVSHTFTPTQLRHAYFKLAKVVHPDKNKTPEAHAKFQELLKAYDTLRDEESKKQYDARMQGKAIREKRLHEMDDKRKRQKEELERKEKQFDNKRRKLAKQKAEQEKLLKIVQETDALVRSGKAEQAGDEYVIAARWAIRKGYGYDEKKLKDLFKKFGKVHSVLIVGNASALITFHFASQALNAIQTEELIGFDQNPIFVEWAAGVSPVKDEEGGKKPDPHKKENPSLLGTAPKETHSSVEVPSLEEHEDLEKLILAQLSSAAEIQNQHQ